MRVLVVYPYFVDHSAAGHALMHDTLQALAAQGHEITVVSGEGGYMQSGAPAAGRPPRRLVWRDAAGPIRVLRTKSYHGHQKGLLGRFLSYAFLAALSPVAVALAPRVDVVLLSPPPLYPIFTALLACRLRRWPVVTEVRDLWPGSIVQMGMLRNPWLIRLTAWMERRVYDASRQIVGLTHGISDDIVARGWPADRVSTLPCSVDPAQLAPDPVARDAVRASHGWQHCHVLMYFGALGEANNLPVLLRAAQRLQRAEPALRIVLVGDGFRRAWCENEIRDAGLENVELVPAVPRQQARDYLSAADVCVVTLQDLPVFAGAIPTKLLEYMACARPVLCGVRGEARAIVETSGAGACFEPDDDARLAELAIGLSRDPERAAGLGARGRAYVAEHFSLARRAERLAAVLKQAILARAT